MANDDQGAGMNMSGGGGGGMMNSPVTIMMQIQMSFYWGKEAIVLFSGWPGEKLSMYVLCLVFIFLLAAALEILHLTSHGKPAVASSIRLNVNQAVIHGLRMGMAYLLMLAVMSFNAGVLIAAVLGHAFGFYFAKARTVAATGGIPANILVL
ncbi:hypothetical protein MLD38_023893 [Melastoma candidum]|uniref:Uncharacterized protein n=1 Tax=Melastoma candidum TaxID=119954 RepID=A0ACB9NS67_9MYRT|nr:hypothetical protein MLD38_023893 [Melastoma candidum]